MASRATAGDFLEEASAQLRLARATPEPAARPGEAAEVAWSLGQVTFTLARYLGDTGAAGYLMTGDAPSLHGWPRAIAEAREPLRQAMRAFGYSRIRQARPVPQNRSQAAVWLACAAKSLTLAKDLLQTHFAPDRTYASEWAPVITSTHITRALAAEVSWWAWQTAPMAVHLANAGTSRSARFEDVRYRLRAAARSLWDAAQTLDTALLTDPATAADLMLLRAIPVNSMPARALPQGAETIAQLCEGTISTAERVRHMTWKPAPASSPAISESSLRHTAGMAVIISHNCGAALETLASRAGHLGLDRLSAGLAESSATAYAAQARWLDAARAWGSQVFTDTRQTRARLGSEAEDLAVWTGRLVYSDGQWAPVHARCHDLRPPEALAQHPSQVSEVVAAVHHAGETLNRMAEAERDQVRAIGNAGRLYLRTRDLPDKLDIPRPYGPALHQHVRALLATYQDVKSASARLAETLGEIAVLTRAPSQILVAIRVAAGLSPDLVPDERKCTESSDELPPRWSNGPLAQPPAGLDASHPAFPTPLPNPRSRWPGEYQRPYETTPHERDPMKRDLTVTQALPPANMNLHRPCGVSLTRQPATRNGPGQDGARPAAPSLPEREAE